MDKQLFLITYESAHWCGASDTKVVVWAEDGVDAIFKASDHMEDEMWELFADEYMDDGSEDRPEDSLVHVIEVVEFTPSHEEWKYFLDPSQVRFYPVIK
jgi:predicted glycosyl hydrolase (DUF1957 family)